MAVTTNPDTFIILLRYADAAGHKLNAIHAAKASGLALRTAYARIAQAREILAAADDSITQDTLKRPEMFEILLRYAEASGHKLSAGHAAAAANIAQRTAYAKIAGAKQASQNETTGRLGDNSADTAHVPNRKRKTVSSVGVKKARKIATRSVEPVIKSEEMDPE